MVNNGMWPADIYVKLTVGANASSAAREHMSVYRQKAAGSDDFICILYDESIQHARELADYLLSLDDNAYAVRYSGRVSVANYDQVISEIGDADTILALTPTTSMRILRADGIPSVIFDSLHAAALESTPFSASVGVDWDASVESLLSGSRTLSYALFPAKD